MKLNHIANPLSKNCFYVDCEFDGHNGVLLSIAVVAQDGRNIYIETQEKATDPWVLENVIPIMGDHDAEEAVKVKLNQVGAELRRFIGKSKSPIIIADSPVDIGRFANAITTSPDGKWESSGFSKLTFIVENVSHYPTKLEGAVQHNAWWDAMALRVKLNPQLLPMKRREK